MVKADEDIEYKGIPSEPLRKQTYQVGTNTTFEVLNKVR